MLYRMAVQKDSGYAWLILLSCMVINFMTIGFCFATISVLTETYMEEFDASLTNVSWIGSSLIAVLLMSGPVVAILIGKLGVRTMAIASSLLHLAGFVSSAFATSWWHVIPTFSVICGFASCCTHVCTMKILTVYFDRHQHMAYAASALGSDAAAISLPFITAALVNNLSYRNSILALSAMLVLAVPCAITFRGAPGPSCTKKTESIAEPVEEVKFGADNDDTKSLGSDNQTPIALSSNGVAKHSIADQNQNDVCSEKLLENNQAEKPCEPEAEIADDHHTEHHTLREHVKLLTKPPVFVFVVNAFLWNMGGAVPAVLTYTYCLDNGYTTTLASLVMTLFGVGSFCGSLSVTISSYLIHRYKRSINRYYLHSGCNLLMAIAVTAIPFLIFSKKALCICMFCLGAGYGALCANLGSMIEHLNGSHLLYLIYGYEMAAAGIASLVGPTVGAQLEEKIAPGTAFFFAGACMFGALVLYVIYALIFRSILTPYSERINSAEPNTGAEGVESTESNL